MHQKKFMIPVVFAMLSGFCSLGGTAVAQVDTNTARLRVFKEAAVTLYPDEFCYGSASPEAIQATDGKGSIFSFNKKVGMPVTLDTPSSYNEYIIEAGRPFTVMLTLDAVRDGVKTSCGPLGTTFYPQAGRNYDVTMRSAGQCYAQVRELHESSPGKVEVRYLPTVPSFPCGAK